ncbi:MAG: hypothetical protein R2744_07315 [Bacteroidales bacterium]
MLSWFIRQDIEVRDFAEANVKSLNVLSRGVDSLGFVFGSDEKFDEKKIGQLLESIYLEAIEINFNPAGSALELLSSSGKL